MRFAAFWRFINCVLQLFDAGTERRHLYLGFFFLSVRKNISTAINPRSGRGRKGGSDPQNQKPCYAGLMPQPSNQENQATRDAYGPFGRSIVESLAVKHITREVAIELAVSLGFGSGSLEIWQDMYQQEVQGRADQDPGEIMRSAKETIRETMRYL